ncbi:MAG TPA: Dyp-type peroxidase [Ramlibacter sp.]|uniref:Dyp-type peroxidase n=1 Tax=Ramlibacter sp. TaxID=1917967 RepID=UPI002CF4B761|nr:Dyp-type peroxidase [Ramlibacter sp.]HVZ43800.1 Dyp-type peroxidase [Ramlibacter sp.]
MTSGTSSIARISQPGILDAVPAVARYVNFVISDRGTDALGVRDALKRLSPLVNGSDVVLGVGPSLVAALGCDVPGLHEFPDLSGHGVKVPSTPGTLWCWIRGDDLGDLLFLTRKVQKALLPAFVVRHVVDAFRHSWSGTHGRDLTGYEDGTENPEGDAAVEAAFAQGMGDGLDGASYVAVQQWLHDLDAFEALAGDDANHHFGRDRVTNEELADSPESAHVKRTAQESFDPPAFLLRRSMPWMMNMQAGLMFVAFGKSLYAFEAQMKRMAGQEDGITDAIFQISRPVNGSYYWCPPMRDGKLDLRHLGL